MRYKDLAQHFQLIDRRMYIDGLGEYDGVFPEAVGVETWHQLCEANDLQRLRDPYGYFKCDDNLYDFIRDVYEDVYEEGLDAIKAGRKVGSPYGIQHTLDNMGSRVLRDMNQVLRGTGVKYTDLRFTQVSDEQADLVEDFVEERLRLSIAYGMKRMVKDETRQVVENRLKNLGNKLKDNIVETMSIEDETLLNSFNVVSDGMEM